MKARVVAQLIFKGKWLDTYLNIDKLALTDRSKHIKFVIQKTTFFK